MWIDKEARETLELIRGTVSILLVKLTAMSGVYSQNFQQRLAKHGQSIFNKLQAYALLHCLTLVDNSFSRDGLYEYASKENLVQLRLALLGVHTASVIQENKDIGEKIVVTEKTKELQRLRGHVSQIIVDEFEY